jgi:hypothetical protein
VLWIDRSGTFILPFLSLHWTAVQVPTVSLIISSQAVIGNIWLHLLGVEMHRYAISNSIVFSMIWRARKKEAQYY